MISPAYGKIEPALLRDAYAVRCKQTAIGKAPCKHIDQILIQFAAM